MRMLLSLYFLAIFRLHSSSATLTQYVNPLFATRGGNGFGGWGSQNRNPGAMQPHPLLRLGPDTTRFDAVLGEVWSKLARKAGYFGSDSHIRAFSHTHVQGAGDADLGNIGVMISRADSIGIAKAASIRPFSLPFPPISLDRSPWASPFTHGDESASPGYYYVGLPALGVNVELTASGPRSGMHRYTCSANGTSPGGSGPISGPCSLILDICHRAHDQPCGAGSTVTITKDATSGEVIVEGQHNDRGEFVRFNYTSFPIYFSMRISAIDGNTLEPLSSSTIGTWTGYFAQNAQGLNATASVGADLDSLGAYAMFTSPAIIEVRVGISAVSVAGARANLIAEQGNQSFDQIVASADAVWEVALGAIQVTLPGDAIHGITDTFALLNDTMVHLDGLNDLTDENNSTKALRDYLETTEGAVIAFQNGWSILPDGYIQRVTDARTRGLTTVTNLPLPFLNVEKALNDLRTGSAKSREKATIARIEDPLSDLAVFYSMLYIALCAPTTYNDVDGSYMGFDMAIHEADISGSRFMSDLSLWDTYRSHAIFLSLVAPRALADISASLLNMNNQGFLGMPRWPFANLYTEDMVGRHGIPLLADCVLTTGVCSGRVTLADASSAASEAITAQDESIPLYVKQGGYIPIGAGSASATLEFAVDDFAAAALSLAAGNTSQSAVFANRAGNWVNVFDTATPAVMPRFSNGSFDQTDEVWNPHPFNSFYTEGNAAQWMWGVPHNMTGLVNSFPLGADQFSDYLQVVLANQTYWTTTFSTFLPNPYCWLGNEPSMLLPWSHAWTGSKNSYRTQFWPRWHLRTYYPPTEDAIPGNDDYGALSSWAVFAYLGIYPVSPTGTFVLGSPVFADVRVLAPPNSAPFSGPSPALHIIAHNSSASRIYVSGARVNGVSLTEPLVTWTQLFPNGNAQEALLEFDMVDEPVQGWIS